MSASTPINEREARIDGQLAENWERQSALRAQREGALTSLGHASGAPMVWKRKQLVCDLTAAELLAHAQTVLDNPELEGRFVVRGSWTDKGEIAERVARYHEIVAQLDATRVEAAPLEAVYEAERWSRFFLVTNGNGHIHSSMSCSTCRITTGFAWLPALSGLGEKDAVDAHGPLLCSVCYPSAPVEWRAPEKTVDPDTCPASGTYEYDRDSFRRTSYSGSGHATCGRCGDRRAPVTTSGKLRKHKAAV